MARVLSFSGAGSSLDASGASGRANGAPVAGPAMTGVLTGAAGVGAIGGLAVMLPMEAGIPVPLPADLVMLGVGARVGAGDIPLWAAVMAFEGIAVMGTAILLFAARGPAHAALARVGPRLGLTASRLARASALVERRGRVALVIGRSTPGLRTLTVIAAGSARVPIRRALPPMVIGSSIFLQLHLFLGYFLGSAARHALRAATAPALAVLGVLLVGAIVFWLARRGRRFGVGGLVEAACPACVALALLSERPRDVGELSAS